jgi:hypothetical protein
MSVHEKEIEPAIVVQIEKTHTPPKPTGVNADAARKRAILTQAVAGVRIQRRCVAREIGLEDVHRAVAIVVSDRDAHPGLRFAVLAVCAPGGRADVSECSIVIVAV